MCGGGTGNNGERLNGPDDGDETEKSYTGNGTREHTGTLWHDTAIKRTRTGTGETREKKDGWDARAHLGRCNTVGARPFPIGRRPAARYGLSARRRFVENSNFSTGAAQVSLLRAVNARARARNYYNENGRKTTGKRPENDGGFFPGTRRLGGGGGGRTRDRGRTGA